MAGKSTGSIKSCRKVPKMLLLKKSKDNKYNPSLQPELVVLLKDTTSFGRSSEFADVVLDSSLSPRMVSRHHAEIYRSDDRFFIECNSLNGVLVNSVKRSKCELQDGDVIVFGGAGAKTLDGSFVSNPQTLSELVYIFRSQQKILDINVNSNEADDDAVLGSVNEIKQNNSNREKNRTLDPVTDVRLIEDSPGEGTSDMKNRTVLVDSDNDDVSKSGCSKIPHAIYKDSSDSSMSSESISKDKIAFKRIKKRQALPFDSDDDDSPSIPVKKIIKIESPQELEAKHSSQSDVSGNNSTFLHDLNEELLCCICRELLVLTHALPCSHSFCYICIRNWLREGIQECPICRSKASLNNLMPVKVLDNMVEKVAVRVLSSEDLEERNTKIQELQDRINGRMEEDSELRAEHANISTDKEYCEKCNLAISNRLLRWVVTFPKTSSTASYHFKCFKPPLHVTFDQIKVASELSRTDLVKVKTVVKK